MPSACTINNQFMNHPHSPVDPLSNLSEPFLTLYERSPIAIYLLNLKDNLVMVNKKGLDLFGYSLEEILEVKAMTMVHPEDRHISQGLIAKLRAGEIETFEIERRYVRKNGEIFWALDTASLAYDKEGKPSFTIRMLQDITGKKVAEARQKEVEEELIKSEQQFRLLFDESPVMYAIVEAHTAVILQCNQTLATKLGYPKDELEGKTLFDIYSPTVHSSVRNTFTKFLKTGSINSNERQIICKDGSTIDVAVEVTAVRDDDGEILYGRTVWHDITQHKQAEQALRQSDQRFRKLFENSPLGVSIADENGRFVQVNQRLTRMLGYDEQELIGKPLSQFTYGENILETRQQARELLSENHKWITFENQYIRKDNSTFWARVIASSMHEVSQNQTFLIGLMEDITEEKKIQETLKANRQRLINAQQVARMGDITHILETGETSWSEGFYNLIGYDPSENIDLLQYMGSIIHPDDVEKLTNRLQRSLLVQSHVVESLEYKIFHKDGTIMHVRDRSVIERLENGHHHVFSTILDITERKQIAIAKEEAEQLNKSIMNASLIGFFIYDLNEGKDIYFNEHYEQIARYSKGAIDEIHPDSFQALFRSEQHKSFDGHLEAIKKAKDGEVVEYEFKFQKPDGQWSWELSREVVFKRDEQGNVIQTLGTFMDITARKEAELSQANMVETLARKNNELERFAYTVSHDLKAPLVTIRGFLGYLSKDIEAENFSRAEKDIGYIHAAVEQMDIFLKDLLELSRAGLALNEPQKIPFSTIVQKALTKVEGQLSNSNIQLRLADTYPVIFGDQVRLVEVVQNLVDNAIKFIGEQEEPIVEVGIEIGNETCFFVRDNGIGIDPAYHDKVFQLFDRLDGEIEGTGVGLALVKRIIEVHNGRIWLESAVGVGSTFYFTLPLANDSFEQLHPQQ